MRAVQLSRAFSARGGPTRRVILSRLVQGEATVIELAATFDMSLPVISRHPNVGETVRRETL